MRSALDAIGFEPGDWTAGAALQCDDLPAPFAPPSSSIAAPQPPHPACLANQQRRTQQPRWPGQRPSGGTTCAPVATTHARPSTSPCQNQPQPTPAAGPAAARPAAPPHPASPRSMMLHTPDPLLHPLLLEFGTAELERQFSARSTSARIRRGDVVSSLSTLALHAFFCVLQAGVRRDRALAICYAALLLCHGLAICALVTRRLPHRCRTPIVIITRLGCDFCIAAGLIAWREPTLASGWPAAAQHLLVNSGLCSLCYQALAYSLPMKVNMFVQPASVLIFSYFMTPGCCRILLAHPTTASLTARIWSAVQWLCSAGRVMGRVEILTASVLASISEAPTLTCTASISFLQAMLGLFAPLVLLYVAERTERQLFWAGLHGYTPGEVAAAARVHPLTKVGCAYVLLFVGLCFWEAAFVLMHLTPQQAAH